MFMLGKGKLSIFVLLLFTLLIIAPALADKGGYTVRPMTPEEIAQYRNNSAAGASDLRPISFWELPLWVQLFYVSGALGSLLVIFKVLPFFLIRTKKIFDNRNREEIYDYIKENPGCTVNDISRERSMNVGSVRYHVDRLEMASRILQVRLKKFTRLFRNSGAYSDREIVVLSALNIRTNKAIMLLVREQPGLSNKLIAGRLGIKESMAHLYLTRLLKEGIVRYERDGQQKLYYLESDVDDILQKMPGQQAAKGYNATV
jgi:predicted transcriptional regulator